MTPSKGATIWALASECSACSWLNCACLSCARAMSMSSGFGPCSRSDRLFWALTTCACACRSPDCACAIWFRPWASCAWVAGSSVLAAWALATSYVGGGLFQFGCLREHAGVGLVLDLVVCLLGLVERNFGLAQLRVVDCLLRRVRPDQQILVAGLCAGKRCFCTGHARLRYFDGSLRGGHIHGIGRRFQFLQLAPRRSPATPWPGRVRASGLSYPVPPTAGPARLPRPPPPARSGRCPRRGRAATPRPRAQYCPWR